MSNSALLDIVTAIIDVLQTTALLQPYVDGKILDDLADESWQLTYDFPLPSWRLKSSGSWNEKNKNWN